MKALFATYALVACTGFACLFLFLPVWAEQESETAQSSTKEKQSAVFRKINSIIIPIYNLNDASFMDAFHLLSTLSLKYDPERDGISMMLSYLPADKKRLASIRLTFSMEDRSFREILDRLSKESGIPWKLDGTMVSFYLERKALVEPDEGGSSRLSPTEDGKE